MSQFEDLSTAAIGTDRPPDRADEKLDGTRRLWRPRRRMSYLDPEGVVRQAPRERGRVTFALAVGWMTLVVLVAVFADVLPLRRYDLILDKFGPRLAPRFSLNEPFGTDVFGRSVASRLAFGARESLQIGIYATLFALTVGSTIGITVGYVRGRLDAIVAVFLDAMIAVPPLVLLLAVAAVGQRNITSAVVALGIIGTPTFVRLARSATLGLSQREYVMAARAMGASHTRTVFRELLPNVVLPISTYAFLFLAYVTVAEATLSFLGLGVPPPTPTWGGMINDARPYLDSKPYLVFVPAACILLTVVSLSVIGDRARRRFDVGESALS